MSAINFVLMATAWGPRHGGINAFNRDFAIGLAAALGTRGQVFCAVINPTDGDYDDAKKGNVTLIPLVGKKVTDHFDTAWAYEIVNWLKKEAKAAPVSWWVGHDVTSGAAALAGVEVAPGSRAALIHHMSYIAYQGFKHDDGEEADAKDAEQKKLFSAPDAALFAVGPLLRDSCRRLSGNAREPVMLIPGFPDRTAGNKATDHLVAISFGRMEAASDRIKQGQLSVAAFGAAIKEACSVAYGPASLKNSPSLYLIGLPAGGSSESKELFKLAEQHAERTVNLIPLPFDQDRKKLLDRLDEANLAFMLSWHEGFGLTGWEAIAAEVPLILSKQSGLFRLLDHSLNGAAEGYVYAIDVEGQRGEDGSANFTPNDLRKVKSAILKISNDIKNHHKRAEKLKTLVQKELVCRWDNTGLEFLKGLGILGASSPTEPTSPPPDNGPPEPDPAQPGSSPSGSKGDKRPQSREERFEILKKKIRTSLERSSRVVTELEVALADPVTKSSPIAGRAKTICDRLLAVRFEDAINVLNKVRMKIDMDDAIDRTAIDAIAEVSGWLFPWLHIRDANIECDQWERQELGEVISLPSDVDSFAEIIMAGIDIRMADFQPIRESREWPRSVVSLSFGTPEEAMLDEHIIGAADEDNIRKSLAAVLNVPKNKKGRSAETVDDSINREIDFHFKNNRRWYIICDQINGKEDQMRHIALMKKIASKYKGLAVIELSMDSSDQQSKFREIQQLLNLEKDKRL